jgi:hypothetical protein
VTEPEYINEFRLAHGTTTVRVHVVAPGGDPMALVQHAIDISEAAAREARRARDENLAYDEVWCVIDVDVHARLVEARTLAGRNRVNLAVSNPCFELWLLLHFAEHTAHLNAGDARRRLRKHLPNYDKHVRFEDVAAGYADAVKRAEALDRRHAGADSEGANPSTGVYRLTERIRQFGKSERL